MSVFRAACPDCGALTVAGVRHEATRTVQVRLCLWCGHETPPLYRRSATVRNSRSHMTEGTCPACGARFQQLVNGTPIYCSRACLPNPASRFNRRAS